MLALLPVLALVLAVGLVTPIAAANAAITPEELRTAVDDAHRLGLPVRLSAKIGADAFGHVVERIVKPIALHASEVRFPHPRRGDPVVVSFPPRDGFGLGDDAA